MADAEEGSVADLLEVLARDVEDHRSVVRVGFFGRSAAALLVLALLSTLGIIWAEVREIKAAQIAILVTLAEIQKEMDIGARYTVDDALIPLDAMLNRDASSIDFEERDRQALEALRQRLIDRKDKKAEP